ncbi:hypothetical protein [Bradymonas sediminis]|uniref:Uncharacterized protein n=1 Tax=Bradymonas sediminis TaxID=1548548 RepID=A0A2Z4FMG9_9DELT|nr:hypothetical protein [Bradymonas sediminis]AWV90153.1 hypothetical protein DN745_12740 [Bradymonas sediminis]TDP75880.1 hypothetical protein DFR33_103227 [Bradymonas sediminis]
MGLRNLIKGLDGWGLLGQKSSGGGLYFEQEPNLDAGLTIQWAVGEDAGRVDLADALVSDAIRPQELREMVRFCARKNLPVGVWLLSGVWCLPTDVDAVARWALNLSECAGPAHIWIDPFAMPPAYRRRLDAHLRRAGARLGDPTA